MRSAEKVLVYSNSSIEIQLFQTGSHLVSLGLNSFSVCWYFNGHFEFYASSQNNSAKNPRKEGCPLVRWYLARPSHLLTALRWKWWCWIVLLDATSDGSGNFPYFGRNLQ